MPQRVKYILVGFSIVAAVSLSVFLVYLYVLDLEGVKTVLGEIKPGQPGDTSKIAAATVPETTTQTSSPPSTTPPVRTQPPPPVRTVPPPVRTVPPPTVPSTVYTVYTASYATERPAAEEVARWNEAGYSSAVTTANNHFRVSVGRYQTMEEAHRFVEEMKEGFENGSWIGEIN